MALTLKDPETNRLAAEVAALAGETEDEAVRKALEERKKHLAPWTAPSDMADRVERFKKYLEEEFWPKLPDDVRGRGISKEEREELLGYGPEGV